MIMFNKYITGHSDKNAIQAAKIKAQAIEEFGKKVERMADEMIATKDRADISMKEYLELKDKTAKYEQRLVGIGRVITALGISAEIIEAIDAKSIEVYTSKDPMRFRTKYMIKFETDE
jgi:hypothetical protein